MYREVSRLDSKILLLKEWYCRRPLSTSSLMNSKQTQTIFFLCLHFEICMLYLCVLGLYLCLKKKKTHLSVVELFIIMFCSRLKARKVKSWCSSRRKFSIQSIRWMAEKFWKEFSTGQLLLLSNQHHLTNNTLYRLWGESVENGLMNRRLDTPQNIFLKIYIHFAPIH